MDKDQAKFEAAVAAEVTKRVAEYVAQIGQQMQMAMQNSLGGVDQANAALEAERQKLIQATEAAHAARAKIEAEAEQLFQEYFETRRTALIEFTQKEQLRNLIYNNLQMGYKVEDICVWLHVEKEQVEAVQTIIIRKKNFRQAHKLPPMDNNPRVFYKTEGRGGTITFQNDLSQFDLWWEFGTDGTLVLVEGINPAQWQSRTKLPLEQRETILTFIAERILTDQTSSGDYTYEIEDNFMSIVRR
ncbi:MAG: hypothetical protein J0L99_08345 [Chitinophagales bacterium]|nr:hypothetical protein [Chitinophagales bacterium]